MFAGFFVSSSHAFWPRAGTAAIAALLIATTQTLAGQVCKPVIAFKTTCFSAMRPPTMERRWNAILSVDASRCATTSGRFEVLFSRLKENGPEVEFTEPFVWTPGVTEIALDFWADEAVEGYRLGRVAACPCRD